MCVVVCCCVLVCVLLCVERFVYFIRSCVVGCGGVLVVCCVNCACLRLMWFVVCVVFSNKLIQMMLLFLHCPYFLPS